MHLRKINLHKFLLSIFIINTTLFGNIFNEDSWSMVEKNKDGAYFKLDFDHLKQILNGAPQTSKGIPSNNILVVPTHTGEKILFKFYKNSVMHPNLAERYPDIKKCPDCGGKLQRVQRSPKQKIISFLYVVQVKHYKCRSCTYAGIIMSKKT